MVNRRALIDTLIYSDIFSTALTEKELYYLLHKDKFLDRNQFRNLIKKSFREITSQKGHFCLKGRESLIDSRLRNNPNYLHKLSIAKKASFYLAFIPTVYFIGLTGSVASGNPGDDDVDLFIITGKKSLFITRLLSILVLSLLGIRRKKSEKDVRDKVCLNMFCDPDGFKSFSKRKNIYVAREIAQMVPLMERENMYSNFLISQNWVKKFVFHAGQMHKSKIIRKKSIFEFLFIILDPLAVTISKVIMGRSVKWFDKKTHLLLFYPDSTEKCILKNYRDAGGLL